MKKIFVGAFAKFFCGNQIQMVRCIWERRSRDSLSSTTVEGTKFRGLRIVENMFCENASALAFGKRVICHRIVENELENI